MRDPNLHTHVVLANKVQGPDGLWRSLDGKTVYGAVVTVSELYDTLLADELARRLPVAFSRRDRGPRRNPAFELDGIGDDVLAHFSARSEQIHCAEVDWVAKFEAEHGRAPTRVETTRARQHLARATRPPKVVRPLRDLCADWANRARALTGLEPVDLAARALAGTYGRALHAHDVGPEVRAAMLAQILEEVSTKRSVWTTWNLGAAALRASKPLRMASPEERLRLLDHLTGQAEAACVHLDDTRDPERRRVGESLFTSTELLAAEKSLIDAAAAEAHLPRRIDDPRSPSVRMRRSLDALAGDQRVAAEAILTSPHLLDALVGPAGSGKTTTLAALALIWRTNCGPVLGLAPSATAAHTLAQALGVPCQTTAKWLHESVGPGAHARAEAYAQSLVAEAGSSDYFTSSSATAGGACTGSGVGPTRIDRVIGVAKAYTTRVGEGPYPTELLGTDGEWLRTTGGEFGTTTGRPRRTAWYDAVVARYANRINGLTDLVLTKLDVLTGRQNIPVAVAYEVDGRRFDEMPEDQSSFHHAKPVYEYLDGWTEDISCVREFEDLPSAAQRYVIELEEMSGTRISSVGVGPGREATVIRYDLLD